MNQKKTYSLAKTKSEKSVGTLCLKLLIVLWIFDWKTDQFHVFVFLSFLRLRLSYFYVFKLFRLDGSMGNVRWVQ